MTETARRHCIPLRKGIFPIRNRHSNQACAVKGTSEAAPHNLPTEHLKPMLEPERFAIQRQPVTLITPVFARQFYLVQFEQRKW